jgi:N-formylmaleamate deformylase
LKKFNKDTFMLPYWDQNDITVNGAKLHYYRNKKNAGKPPLVLAHGFSDDSLCWNLIAADLQPKYDVILPDARGHGMSERVRPGEPVDMTSDLAGFIQGLGLERPIVGGHALGATVALQLSVRYPELVRALFLEEPPWFLPEGAKIRPLDEYKKHPMAGFMKDITTHSTRELIGLCHNEHPNWSELVTLTWCSAKKRLDPDILSIMKVQGTDWLEMVESIACPVLVIAADVEKGGIITPELEARVKKLNNRINFVHIPGAGHYVRFEDQTAYVQALNAFLDTLKD